MTATLGSGDGLMPGGGGHGGFGGLVVARALPGTDWRRLVQVGDHLCGQPFHLLGLVEQGGEQDHPRTGVADFA